MNVEILKEYDIGQYLEKILIKRGINFDMEDLKNINFTNKSSFKCEVNRERRSNEAILDIYDVKDRPKAVAEFDP